MSVVTPKLATPAQFLGLLGSTRPPAEREPIKALPANLALRSSPGETDASLGVDCIRE